MDPSMETVSSTPASSRLNTPDQTICPTNVREPLDTGHQARVSSGPVQFLGPAPFDDAIDALIEDVVKKLPASHPYRAQDNQLSDPAQLLSVATTKCCINDAGVSDRENSCTADIDSLIAEAVDNLPASHPWRSHDAQAQDNQLSNPAERPSFETTKCYMDEEDRNSDRRDRSREKGSVTTSADWRFRKSRGDKPDWKEVRRFNQNHGYGNSSRKSTKRPYFSKKKAGFNSQDPLGRVSKGRALSTSASSRRSSVTNNSSPIHPPASDNVGGPSVPNDTEVGLATLPSDETSRRTKTTRRRKRLPTSGTRIESAVADSL